MRLRAIRALLLATILLAGNATASAEDSAPEWPSADEVLDTVKRTLAWYQQARAAMQTAKEAAIILAAREDEQTVVRVVQRAFEAARAQAALVEQLATPDAPAATPTARRAERRAKLEAAIREGEREVTRLRERARSAAPARREALEREATAAANRLALDHTRLELLTTLQQADVSLTAGDADLTQEIQALQETAPELSPAPAPPKTAAAPPPAAAAPPANGTWAVLNRLLSLQRARTSLAQLAASTHSLAGDVEAEAQRTRDALRELSQRLRVQTGGPGTDGTVMPTEAEFRRELGKLKHLGAALAPLRAELALLHRFEGDIRTWQRTIDRETRKRLQELALGLAGMVIGLGVIVVGAVAWKIAANRYVKDPYRRRLFLRARKIVAGVAVVLLLVFHFTSELTALVTALGFAAAGIAFALQNVILAVAGYFSMMAPNGIRVGDRVSLQGPFGYVHGEVIEIGLVRLRLRELTEGLEPTGRTVVFPNSVVFTGSFFKHPPAQAKAA